MTRARTASSRSRPWAASSVGSTRQTRYASETAFAIGLASRTSALLSTRLTTTRGLGDGKSTGRAIYTVDGLQHDAPTFYDDILVEFSEDVIAGKILDFAGVKEDAGGVCVTTACDGRYLLGLGEGLFVGARKDQ